MYLSEGFQRPSQGKIFLSETLGPVAPNRVAPQSLILQVQRAILGVEKEKWWTGVPGPKTAEMLVKQ